MGLGYSYEIVVPAGGVGKALAEVAVSAPAGRREPPVEVTLPGGEKIVLPFTSRFRSEPVDCSAGGPLELDTSLMVPVDDDEVCAYADAGGLDVDPLGRVAIGYVYLTVEFARSSSPGFASLDFMAAATGMSLLFERSASVREVFTGLTAGSGGVCCLLDKECVEYRVCWLNGEAVRETVPGPRFADMAEVAAEWRRPDAHRPPP
ncbi:hypothetical protein ABZ901_23040 [Actinacidiphila alni]|uniref:hypothetical protein n=1 Tax=Actinacidiphila alni TaxID=380248 RepID=UPI0034057BFB